MKSTLEDNFEKVEKKKSRPRVKIKKHVPRVAPMIGIGVGLIIALNVAIYLHHTQIESAQRKLINKLAKAHAEEVAGKISSYAQQLIEALNKQADRTTLQMALVAETDENLKRASRSVASAFEGVKAVQFFKVGSAELNDKLDPPVRFTELELIRQAEKRNPVSVEAAKLDKTWWLKLVAPVPFDATKPVSSTMLVTLSIDGLINETASKDVSLGRFELIQQVKGSRAVSLYVNGQGDAGKTVELAVSNSPWKIKFTPSNAIALGKTITTWPTYAMMAAITLVLIVIGVYVGRVVGGIVDQKLKEKAGTEETESEEEIADKSKSNSTTQTFDVLDVDITAEDEGLLGLEEADEPATPVADPREEDILEIEEDDGSIPDVVFRAYDIRGIANTEITTELAELVGQALGSEAIDSGQEVLIVARDGRLSSPQICDALIKGITQSGCNVLNIGMVPTPVLYFATATLKESQSGVMVTASHNPGNYNGFKVVMNGKSRSGEDIKAIRRRIIRKDLYDGEGNAVDYDIVSDYIDTIFADVALAGDVSLVIDAANGVTGAVAPQLFEELGCQVTPLFCEVDGKFPNHGPDPSVEENLKALIEKVTSTNADLGVAFDGDGDRVIVVTGKGRIIWPDQLLMIFAKDIVSRNPGADVVFDVKSTKHLASEITSYGGRPIMWKTGHAPMKNKMLECNAVIGGEYSGHIFIKDRWFGFDDGMYAAARLIEILSLQGQTLDEMLDEFPSSPSTPEIRVPIMENKKFDVVKHLMERGDFGDGRLTAIDGIRVDYTDGWGLVRASNTSANLTLRFEADNDEALARIKNTVATALSKIDKNLDLSWNK